MHISHRYILFFDIFDSKLSNKYCVIFIGAQIKGCRYDKKPQYRYSSCHGYDVSAFNIVLGIHYQFDSTPYVIKENADDYFIKVSTGEAQKNLQNLILNITDPPAIT